MTKRSLLPSLRTRLVAVIFLALLPAFALLVTVAEFERNRALDNARQESMTMAQLLKTQFTAYEDATREKLAWLALLPDMHDPSAPACEVFLEQFLSTQNDLAGVAVATPDGEVHCVASRTPVTGPLNNAEQPYFMQVLATREFSVGGFAVDRTSHKPILTFGQPVLDANGELQSVIGIAVDLEAFNQRMAGTQVYRHAALVVLDQHGTIVLRQPDPEQFLGTNVKDNPLVQIVMRTREGVQQHAGLDSADRLYAFTTIGTPEAPRFYVWVGLEAGQIFGPVDRMLRSSLVGLSVLGVLALAAAWLSAEVMIVRRTQHVVNAALRMRGGDFSARARLADDRSELGQLAQTFDSMADALQEREAENRRLMEEMQQLNAELEVRVTNRTEQLQVSHNRLLDSQAELRRLSEQLMKVTEQERMRISREIHDQLGQLLTGVKMQLRSMDRTLAETAAKRDNAGAGALVPDQVPQFRERLGETTDLVDETIRTVRRIAADLRPGLLDDFGLTAAVEWQLQEFENRTGLRCTLDGQVDEARLSRDMATAAFRICQEALTNVARHAEATAVHVELRTEDSHFTLIVRDNGLGINPEVLHRARSLGILGMRERARQCNGTVQLVPADETLYQRGTELRLELPLEEGN